MARRDSGGDELLLTIKYFSEHARLGENFGAWLGETLKPLFDLGLVRDRQSGRGMLCLTEEGEQYVAQLVKDPNGDPLELPGPTLEERRQKALAYRRDHQRGRSLIALPSHYRG